MAYESLLCMAGPEGPRYRPNPTRLTALGVQTLESARTKHLPHYSEYTSDGYVPIGFVSQFDPFILRRGKDLHVQAARNFASEQVIQQLHAKYRRRGKDVEIIAGQGAILVKSGRRQQEVASEGDISIHKGGVTFYVRDRTPDVSLGSAFAVAPLERLERLEAVAGSIRRSGVLITV